MCNTVFTCVFVVELILKLLALGCREFWRSGWNIFDSILVAGSLVDLVFQVYYDTFITLVRRRGCGWGGSEVDGTDRDSHVFVITLDRKSVV